MPEAAVVVEVLHLGVHDIGSLERLTGAEGALDGAAVFQVTNLNAIEGLALTGFDEFVVNDGVRIALENDLHTRSDFAGGIARHVGSRPWAVQPGHFKGRRMITTSLFGCHRPKPRHGARRLPVIMLVFS